jgi:hypothetical protein
LRIGYIRDTTHAGVSWQPKAERPRFKIRECVIGAHYA